MTRLIEMPGDEKVCCPKCKKELPTEEMLFGLSGIAEVGCDDCQVLFRVRMSQLCLETFEVLPWNDEENE